MKLKRVTTRDEARAEIIRRATMTKDGIGLAYASYVSKGDFRSKCMVGGVFSEMIRNGELVWQSTPRGESGYMMRRLFLAAGVV